ncbi:hypothetical protein EDB80DRAFT_692359 [Ilyonectria destructans]|nr:hypothetical protein EDB80DRAFT_692359 [Ilyonectria destructans]
MIDPRIGVVVAAFGSAAAYQRREKHEPKRQIEGSIPSGRPVVSPCLRVVVGWSRMVNRIRRDEQLLDCVNKVLRRPRRILLTQARAGPESLRKAGVFLRIGRVRKVSPPLQKPTDAKNPVTFNKSLGLNGKDAESSLAERLLIVLEKLVDERPTSDSLSSGDKAPTEAKEPQADRTSKLAYKSVEEAYDNLSHLAVKANADPACLIEMPAVPSSRIFKIDIRPAGRRQINKICSRICLKPQIQTISTIFKFLYKRQSFRPSIS